MLKYTGDTPARSEDSEYTYAFSGWTPKIMAAITDAVYTATYSSTIKKYTITFVNGKDVLSAGMWEYGTMPSCEEPTKEDDEQYSYVFAGWFPNVETVTEDATYTVTYTAIPKTNGIEDVYFNDVAHRKKMIDGRIYILRGDKTYTITGVKVK